MAQICISECCQTTKLPVLRFIARLGGEALDVELVLV